MKNNEEMKEGRVSMKSRRSRAMKIRKERRSCKRSRGKTIGRL